MKKELCLCLSLLIASTTLVPQIVHADSSDVTLIVENENQGNSGSNNNSGGGGGSSSGNNNGTVIEHPDEIGKEAGGTDGSGKDYYLKPGILVEEGIDSGYVIGKNNWIFDPNGPLTRAEFATIIDRIFVFKDERITKRFDDTVGHWAEDAICRLASNGIIYGVSSREFNPDGTLKRDEALMMLGRVLYTAKYSKVTDKVDLENHYAKEALSKILNSGIYDKLDSNYDISAIITRDEMIHIVNNIIYPRNKSALSLENYLSDKSIFTDLLNNKNDLYYGDCLVAIDKNYLNSTLGGISK